MSQKFYRKKVTYKLELVKIENTLYIFVQIRISNLVI